MPDQLSLLVQLQPQPTPAGTPPVIADILHAARSLQFTTRIVRGAWGIGIGPKRKWILTGDCCCALALLLVVKGAVAEPHEHSPRATAARVFGLHDAEIDEFIRGFDDLPGAKTRWREYGQHVARELGVST
jgi:hypothetical protein